MASEQVGGAVQGAAAGAKVGAAFGGVGAIFGAVIGGVVGFVAGALSNKKKKLAKKAGKEADRIKRQQQAMQLAVQRRDNIREARVARSRAVAAGASEERSSGSGATSVAGSISQQLAFGLNYFDDQVILDYNNNEYRKKAGKYAAQANDINTIINSFDSIGTLGANVVGSVKQPKK